MKLRLAVATGGLRLIRPPARLASGTRNLLHARSETRGSRAMTSTLPAHHPSDSSANVLESEQSLSGGGSRERLNHGGASPLGRSFFNFTSLSHESLYP